MKKHKLFELSLLVHKYVNLFFLGNSKDKLLYDGNLFGNLRK